LTQKILEYLKKFKNILQEASEIRKKAGDSSEEIDLLLKTIDDYMNAATEEVYMRDAIISDFALAKPGSEEKLEEGLQLSSSEESHDVKSIEFITKEQIEDLELQMFGVLSPEELTKLTPLEKESLTVDTTICMGLVGLSKNTILLTGTAIRISNFISIHLGKSIVSCLRFFV
jgi:hypothetical protein